jgi:diketogulonate reductase-like aldo/keto reductase
VALPVRFPIDKTRLFFFSELYNYDTALVSILCFSGAVKDSGIERSKLFICGSVVSNRASGFDAAYAATTRGWKQNMEAFSAGNIEYLDQIMLDYPGPDCDSIRGQWKAFEEMAAQKLTKTMAVSNFSPAQLDCVLSTPSIKFKPVVNQLPLSVAYHPGGVKNTVAANSERGLIVQAWAPLGGSLGGRFSKALKSKCGEVGKKYGGKSYAQVALRWLVQNGAAFTTQSQNAAHFAEDLDIFDFELTPEDMATLDQLV